MKVLTAALLFFFACVLAPAQQDESAAPIRVARLTSFSGAVDVLRLDNTGDPESRPALNMPLGEGTRITTSDYAQAELEFEDGSTIRLTPRSALSIDSLALEGGVARSQLTVLGGLVYLELRRSAGYLYSVSAGSVTLQPVENSIARVSLEGSSPAVFSVLSGSVRLEHGFSAEVRAGESLQADTRDDSRYYLNGQITAESWDGWNAERDRAAADQASVATAAREGYAGVQGYGWSDLDASGTWYDVPGEGQVWQPAAADEQFDPYGFGSWVWQGVGYAWASGYSWGWVPFRCGHWSFYPSFGWGWQADGLCGRWGSAGGTVLLGKRRPQRYTPVSIPLHPPTRVHPMILVRDQNGPRPALLGGAPQRVHGEEWKPLPRIGTATNMVAGSLARDYPVNLKTHSAITGIVPRGEQSVVQGRAPGSGPGWQRIEPTGGRAAPAEAGNRPIVMHSGSAPSQSPAANPVRGTTQPAPVSARPVRTEAPEHARPAPTANPAPVRTPVRTVTPVSAPPATTPSPIPPPSPAPRLPTPTPPPASAPARVPANAPKL